MSSQKITVKGKVTGTTGGKVNIKILNPDRCEDCGICLDSDKKLTVSAENGLKEEDRVSVEFDCTLMRRIIFWLYFVPALFLIGGFTVGYLWKGNRGGFAGGVIFLALGYIGVKKVTSGFKNKIKVRKNEKG
ncbi:MAG: SoxR reducing system RseC family protein [Elusimicrobiota bacterium]